MMLKSRSVIVTHVPEKVERNTERHFVRELSLAMQCERPSVVLDCSRLRQMDAAAAHLLLSCLEQAMKCNGDVRLAGLPAQARQALAAWGAEGLFRIFDTPEQAADSFKRRTASLAQTSPENSAALASENAA